MMSAQSILVDSAANSNSVELIEDDALASGATLESSLSFQTQASTDSSLTWFPGHPSEPVRHQQHQLDQTPTRSHITDNQQHPNTSSSSSAQCMKQTPTATAVKVHLTLPIACLICLQKVRTPVICKNRHAFCEPCIQEWLKRKSECPSCRCAVTLDTPFLPVLGGVLPGDSNGGSPNNTSELKPRKRKRVDHSGGNMEPSFRSERSESCDFDRYLTSTRRRVRVCEVLQEYEEDLQDCETEIKRLEKLNKDLEEQLKSLSALTLNQLPQIQATINKDEKDASSRLSMELDDPFADSKPPTTPLQKKLFKMKDKTPNGKSNADEYQPTLQDLRAQLDWTQRENERLLKELSAYKQQAKMLQSQLPPSTPGSSSSSTGYTLSPVKQTSTNPMYTSPVKNGGSTITLRVRISELEKENQNLHLALLKSDEYIEHLEKRLAQHNVAAAAAE